MSVTQKQSYYKTDKFDRECAAFSTKSKNLNDRANLSEGIEQLAEYPFTTFFTLTQDPKKKRIRDPYQMLDKAHRLFYLHTRAHWNGYAPSGESCLQYHKALENGKNNFTRKWGRGLLKPSTILSVEKTKAGVLHVHGLATAPVIPNAIGEKKWCIHLLRSLVTNNKTFGLPGFKVETPRDTAKAVGYCLKYIMKDSDACFDINLNRTGDYNRPLVEENLPI